MSTTPPIDDPADRPPSLDEALAVWAGRTPHVDAPLSALAAWFDLKVDLLAPITADPEHPDYDKAREFARVAAQSAKSLRDKEAGQ